MPKEITHCLFVEEVIHQVDLKNSYGEQVSKLLEKHPQYIYCGSVGPDIPYYDINIFGKLTCAGEPWGDLIHGQNGEDNSLYLRESALLLRDMKPEVHEKCLAFMLGYLSHIALDRTLHPFVYHYAGNYYHTDLAARKNSIFKHRIIETSLDLFLLSMKKTTLNKYGLNDKLNLSTADMSDIFAMLAKSLGGCDSELNNVEPIQKMYIRAFKKQKLFVKLFQKPFLKNILFITNKFTKFSVKTYSSLFYPSDQYEGYLKKKNMFDIRKLTSYRDPVTNHMLKFNFSNKYKEAEELTIKLWQTYCDLVYDKININDFHKVFKGYSLNNGYINKPVKDMKYYNPLHVNGNFKKY